MVINQKETIYGFNPRTGKKLWSCDGIQDYVVPVPVSHNGVVYCLGGRSNRCIAVRLGGRGDVTETHKLWEVSTGANVTSPVYYDGHVYWASDKAVANCLKAESGEKVFQQRLPTRARIYASIVRAGERLYVTTRDQGVVVLAAEPEYRELARNVIADDEGLANASPAISNNQLLLRTDSYLYCIGQQAAE
jgi:outer membrane protein assembly factor BamB